VPAADVTNRSSRWCSDPEALFESEFFGHRKGRSLGDRQPHRSDQSAQEGSLLLDEIGDMPPHRPLRARCRNAKCDRLAQRS
jgi:transcriptional regulator of aromatic amino acid metabolism